MKLVLPNKKYKNSYYELIESAEKNDSTSELGNALIRKNETFLQMLKRLENRKNGKNISTRDVPSTIYWIVESNKVVGTIDLRHKLNDDYENRLGHVAYYIKKDERKKGYATRALKKALEVYKKHNIESIFVMCYKDNLASSKVILKNGGMLVNEKEDKMSKKVIEKYIINIPINPKIAWLTTNRTCNNNCKWCYTGKYRTSIMDFEKIKKIVKELKKMKVKKIILIGGEPSINEDIFDIVEYIAKENIEVSMATNGRKFSNSTFSKKMINKGLNSCNISIKGINENEYIKNTQMPGFNEMIDGYHNLNKMNVNVSLSYVLYDKDLKKIDNLIKILKKNNLNNIVFQLYKPSIDDEDPNAPTINDLAKICEYTFNAIKNTNIDYHFEMSIPLCTIDAVILSEMLSSKRISTCCHISKGKGIVFDTNFDILPCNHFVGHKLNAKSINPKKILTFWNSSIPQQFRKKLLTYPSEKCECCKLWSICGGGCMLRWLHDNPNDFINDKYLKGGD